MRLRLRDWWNFLVYERVGYRRPSPVTSEDWERLERADAQYQEMQDTLQMLKTTVRARTPHLPDGRWF